MSKVRNQIVSKNDPIVEFSFNYTKCECEATRLNSACICDKIVATTDDGRGMTYREVKQLWAAICNPDDWKEEVHCMVSADLVTMALATIPYFTAVISPDPKYVTTLGMFYIYNLGYRRGPAN